VNRHLYRLNPASGLPIYIQLADQIKHAIEMCLLMPGDQLPSVRALAQELVISPNTVVKAYAELAADDVVELRQGSGAFIADQERQRRVVDMVKIARREARRLIASFRERGLSEGEIRRILDAEIAAHQDEHPIRGPRS
jgi:GntR family transcriptional regulator